MSTSVLVPTDTALRIGAADPVYGAVLDFLIDEADLLDSGGDFEWLDVLTDDIVYRMPARKTLYRKDIDRPALQANIYNDNRFQLMFRAQRNAKILSAFDRDPDPRFRRLIGNLILHEGEAEGEYRAASSIAIFRNRFDDENVDFMTARRNDVIRRTPDGLRLAKRTVLLDQAVVRGIWTNVFF